MSHALPHPIAGELSPMPLPTETQCERQIDTTHRATQLTADQLVEVIQWRRKHPENSGVLDCATEQVSRLATSIARLQIAHAIGAAALARIRGDRVTTHRVEVRRVGAAAEGETLLEK
jgi:hypothetical protein